MINFNNDRIMDGDEVMDLLGVCQSTLQAYRNKRLITFSQVGKKIFYKQSDVLDFIERHKKEADK